MTMLRASLALTCLLTARAALAAPLPQLVMLRFSGKGVSESILDSASERASSAALRASPGRFKVVTRDMLATIVGEERLVKCEFENRCELDLGTGLGTEYMLSGSIRALDEQWESTVKLYDIRKLDLIGQTTISAASSRELLAQMDATVSSVLEQGRLAAPRVMSTAPAPRASSPSGPAVASPERAPAPSPPPAAPTTTTSIAPIEVRPGNAGPVRIGAAVSLTGAAAAYGAVQRTCIQAAIDEINRVSPARWEVQFEDDASTKERGIAVFEKLIHQTHVAAIIGPTLSNTATAADPVAQQGRVPVIGISNTASRGITDIGDYIWRVSLTEGQVIPGALQTLHAKLGFQKAGVLYGNDDAFTRAGYDAMKAALADLKIAVVGEQTFAKPDRDYDTQLTALLALKPDVLVVSALVENASGIIAQARQLGWTGPIFGGTGFNSPVLMKKAGPAAEGVYVGTAWNRTSPDEANQQFLAVMKARGVDPDQFCAQAYTGVLVVAEAIKLSGGKGGLDDIKAGFEKVKDLPTPLGKFSFLPSRDASHEPGVRVVRYAAFQSL
jgi:branched-chain amino acid transport system substrate-binding protein